MDTHQLTGDPGFLKMLREAAKDTTYHEETLKLRICECIQQEMEHQGIGRAELAERMGVSKSLITRLLRSDHNPTVETLARVAFHLNRQWAYPQLQPLAEGAKPSHNT